MIKRSKTIRDRIKRENLSGNVWQFRDNNGKLLGYRLYKRQGPPSNPIRLTDDMPGWSSKKIAEFVNGRLVECRNPETDQMEVVGS